MGGGCDHDSLHPVYPADGGQECVSPRVLSPQLSPRNQSPRPSSGRVAHGDRQQDAEGSARVAHAPAGSSTGAAPGAPPSAVPGGFPCAPSPAQALKGYALKGYGEALRHGLTPPEYLSAELRAGQGALACLCPCLVPPVTRLACPCPAPQVARPAACGCCPSSLCGCCRSSLCGASYGLFVVQHVDQTLLADWAWGWQRI